MSGQAVSDSVLIVANSHNNHNWSQHTVLNHGAAVRCRPGAIGGQVNASLAPYQTKIGPDPASIDSCMIGGNVSNNSSGGDESSRVKAKHRGRPPFSRLGTQIIWRESWCI